MKNVTQDTTNAAVAMQTALPSWAKSTRRSRADLAEAKRNGDFKFFCENNDHSDADRILAELIASGAVKIAS